MKRRIWASALLGLSLSAATLALAGPAAAVTPVNYTVLDFTGVCAQTDCTGDGTGVLTLQNLTNSANITQANFVEFTYTSNLIALDITAATATFFAADFSGDLSEGFVSLDGPNVGETQNHAFGSDFPDAATDGLAWYLTVERVARHKPHTQTGPASDADHGPLFSWTLQSGTMPAAVPEPSSWALMILGTGLAGASLRARRKRPQAAI